jgi:3-polyprenyl-4-hydroxybenzoate decarboxylase
MISELVIHYGIRIHPYIYDHNIPINKWKQVLNYLSQNIHNKDIINIKQYQFDDLTYEFNTQNYHYQCWIDTINNINDIVIKNALTYQRTRQIIDEVFQPINCYYNDVNINRHIFKINNMSIVLDDKLHTHEIMILYHDLSHNSNTYIHCKHIDTISHLLNS